MSDTSPKKLGSYGDLTVGETKLLLASVLCTTGGKIDTEKLGVLTDTKKKSAGSRFPSAKRKLEKLFEDKLDKTDEGVDSNSSPVKDKSPVKRRRKTPKAQPELEQSDSEVADKDTLTLKTKAKPELEVECAIKVESDHSEEDPKGIVAIQDDTWDIKAEPLE